MAKLLNMLITLPVIILPVAALTVKPATAEMVSPSQALEIMARSEAASAKCGVLTRSELSELKQYTARAEIAAAQRLGPEAANDTVSSGRAQGRAIACSGSAAADVYEALEAARMAVAQANGGRRMRPSQSRSVRLTNSTRTIQIERSSTLPKGSIAAFQRVATAYFVEKRCRFLAYSKARSLWQVVRSGQSEAIATNGRKSVNNALKQARFTAERMSCDAKAARLVRSAYASYASN